MGVIRFLATDRKVEAACRQKQTMEIADFGAEALCGSLQPIVSLEAEDPYQYRLWDILIGIYCTIVLLGLVIVYTAAAQANKDDLRWESCRGPPTEMFFVYPTVFEDD